jgi:hypothetical protein
MHHGAPYVFILTAATSNESQSENRVSMDTDRVQLKIEPRHMASLTALHYIYIYTHTHTQSNSVITSPKEPNKLCR